MLREAERSRSRRTPYPRAVAIALQGIPATLGTKRGEDALRRSRCWSRARGPSTRGRRAERDFRFAQDDRVYSWSLIAWPANSIGAPNFSAKSAQRGFFDSINAIFFALVQPFSCFSRPIAL